MEASTTPEDPGPGVDGSTGIAASSDTTPATTSSSNSSSSSSGEGDGGGYGMTLVYDKEWSSARLSGGMSFA